MSRSASHPANLDSEANADHLGDFVEVRGRHYGPPVPSACNQPVLFEPHQRFAHGALGAAELGGYMLLRDRRARRQLGQNHAPLECVIQRIGFAELKQRNGVGRQQRRISDRR